jgi:predicted metalloprotease
MAQWDKIISRGTVEDRRSMIPIAGGLGLTGVAIFVIASLLFGGDPAQILLQLQNIPIENQTSNREQFEGADTYEVFASTVLGSNNAMWENIFNQIGSDYQEPTLVLFRTATQSGCGGATSQVGPHYCPLDQTIYLDETFFDELERRLGAQGGDVAEAYVIAHEVGHHAQNLLGIMDETRNAQNANPEAINDLSINLELQADCFAGLWAHSIRELGVFAPGEIQEAMDAAAAVGDDNIQEKTTGQINPETWNHGSSDQRVSWFERGYEQGNLSACTIENLN